MTITNVVYNDVDYSKYQYIDNTFENQKGRCNCLNYKVINGKFKYDPKTISFNRCNNHVDDDKDFCETHKNCLTFMRLFTNSYEPDFEPEKWNNDKFVKGSHNCYAYFLSVPNKSLTVKCKNICKGNEDCFKNNTCQNLIPQPGDASLLFNSGDLSSKSRNYVCNDMIDRIKADNPQIKSVNFTNKCPKNYYKGSMVVDHKKTFHFYRLNKDGKWSHKPGITEVKTIDASKKTIVVPHLADRNYKRNGGHINYDKFCGYFCIPLKKESITYSA